MDLYLNNELLSPQNDLRFMDELGFDLTRERPIVTVKFGSSSYHGGIASELPMSNGSSSEVSPVDTPDADFGEDLNSPGECLLPGV